MVPLDRGREYASNRLIERSPTLTATRNVKDMFSEVRHFMHNHMSYNVDIHAYIALFTYVCNYMISISGSYCFFVNVVL